MRKLLLCVTLLLLTNAHAAGQAGDAQADAPAPPGRLDGLRGEAARLLESQGHRDRAWGAYLAGRNGLDELAPALVQTLSDPALAFGTEEALVRQAALDALIRLGAQVPAGVLRALPDGFVNEALILLASAPEDNRAALLEMFAALPGEGGTDARWLAVGNLLAATKAPGFAALLLRDLKVGADIAVMDGDGNWGLGSAGGGGCGCGGLYVSPEGFPPVSYYRLTGGGERGAVVVAPGRHPVFYFRTTYAYGGDGCPTTVVRDTARVEYLARLLDTTEEGLDFDARTSESVVCTDTRQCRRELAGVRGRIARSYAALVGRLAENGLLDGAGDAPASPPMTFTLYDQRRRKTFPLPDRLNGVAVNVADAEPAEDAAEGEAP